MQCKRAQTGLPVATLMGIFLALVVLGGISYLIFSNLNKADEKAQFNLCKATVAARDAAKFEIGAFGQEIVDVSAPIPRKCRTFEKKQPVNTESTNQLKADIAKYMAKCWEQFGEGRIQDIFNEADQLENNCFICYTYSTLDKGFDKITSNDMSQFLFETAYLVEDGGDACFAKNNGGICSSKDECFEGDIIDAPTTTLDFHEDNTICKAKNKGCCYSEFGCYNRGGICKKQNPDQFSFIRYEDSQWDCPTGETCFVPKDNYYTYESYIRRFGGPGNIHLYSDIEPGRTYAIAFGSPTDDCKWCTGASGIIAVASLATGGAGGVVSFAIIGATRVIATYAISKTATEATNSLTVEQLFERDKNTIYLVDLNTLVEENLCTIVI